MLINLYQKSDRNTTNRNNSNKNLNKKQRNGTPGSLENSQSPNKFSVYQTLYRDLKKQEKIRRFQEQQINLFNPKTVY